MSRETFHISDENPNDVVGGGGCVCSDTKVSDCVGPFAIFYAHDQESVQSPHTVICAACAVAVVDQAHEFADELAIDSDVVEVHGSPIEDDLIPEV